MNNLFYIGWLAIIFITSLLKCECQDYSELESRVIISEQTQFLDCQFDSTVYLYKQLLQSKKSRKTSFKLANLLEAMGNFDQALLHYKECIENNKADTLSRIANYRISQIELSRTDTSVQIILNLTSDIKLCQLYQNCFKDSMAFYHASKILITDSTNPVALKVITDIDYFYNRIPHIRELLRVSKLILKQQITSFQINPSSDAHKFIIPSDNKTLKEELDLRQSVINKLAIKYQE